MRVEPHYQSTTPSRAGVPDSRLADPGKALIRIGFALAFISAIVALSAAGSPNNGDGPRSASIGVSTHPDAASPIAHWSDDVIDDLEDIEEDLESAKATVGNQEGPLEEPGLSGVDADLDAALSLINAILDPNQFPSLDPPDAGKADTSVSPSTLPEYAKLCADLAADAVDEALSTLASAETIGSHLKTIRHLITRASPHSYRTEAGIE
jgi:hypothetical protein